MCGIAGFIGEARLDSTEARQGDQQLLKRMTDRIHHRGPDDEGFLIDEPSRAFLGMRRLSIIDVAGGRQPIFNEDGTVGVVYNGEIYNYQELRKALEEKGHRFKTNSDTEVLVHLYEEHGTGLCEKLNGMFAIALWDAKNQRLVLGRDRVGEKPLYYSQLKDTFFFASELKVFSQIPGFPKVLNHKTFITFIDQGYCVGNETIWKGVKKLGAGEWLVFEGGKIEIGRYWDIPGFNVGAGFTSAPNGQTQGLPLQEAIKQLDSLLSDAVKIRLMSEVPLGVFLSGGLDSSLITYYAQKNSSQKINTFSVKFEDESYDESAHARRVAEHVGTEHTEMTVSEQELLSIIDQLPEIMDEPLADSSLIPTYWLSKLTRQHVTVALGGDAGDELFWGYQTFLAWKYWNILRRIPGHARSLLSAAVKQLPSSDDYFSLDFKLKRGLLHFDPEPASQHFRWFSPFSPRELSQLFAFETYSPELCYSNKWGNRGLTGEARGLRDSLNHSAYLYQKYYLTDDIFTKVDRASMANSLETRAPFVDWRVIEFANSLPAEYKLRNGETKYILKKLGEKVLPKGIANRKKHGFPSPVDRWMRGPLKDKANEALSHKAIRKHGLLNADYVQFLWDDFLNGNHYRARQIWTLFTWQLWWVHNL